MMTYDCFEASHLFSTFHSSSNYTNSVYVSINRICQDMCIVFLISRQIIAGDEQTAYTEVIVRMTFKLFYFAFKYFGFERTWSRLFQKRVVRTNIDLYVCITRFSPFSWYDGCSIRVITKLPNSEQSYKGKVKTHKYINRRNQSTTGKLWKP